MTDEPEESTYGDTNDIEWAAEQYALNYPRHRAEMERLEAERDKLAAQVKTLTAALEPFAKNAEQWHDFAKDDWILWGDHLAKREDFIEMSDESWRVYWLGKMITLGKLRNAQRALVLETPAAPPKGKGQ